MEKTYLLDLNQRGLIPGPDESESAFFTRCKGSPRVLSQTLFDIFPDWVNIQYEKRGLRFWEGGCTWIGRDQTTIQLHPAFLKNTTHLGYSMHEVLAHELVHAVRSAFDEPVYEEILAYQTSPSLLRRFWGPIIRTPTESLIGVLVILLCATTSFFEPLYVFAMTTFFALFGFAILRLVRTQRQFKRTLKNVIQLIGKEKAFSFLLHLSDQEITYFSRIQPDAIMTYAHKMAQSSLRWKQIIAAYF